jgi:hypothetical protein
MKPPLVALFSLLPFVTFAQSPSTDTQVPVIFSGGHETVGEDRGRPVILIASALKVPPEVFREAFRHVKPAGPNEQPQEEQVRKNKQALMSALSPYGVTDERLNEVSNRYRYRRDRGEMWPASEAKAFATIHNGVVTGFTITNAGFGYSSPPQLSLQGMPDVPLVATLSFDTDFGKNGAVKEIAVSPAK